MTTKQKARFVRQALDRASGDDLERANMAFGGMTDKQLDSQWGQSGRTARQIWQEYKDHRQEWTEASEWFNKLMQVHDLDL